MNQDERKMTIYFNNGEQLGISFGLQSNALDAVSRAEEALAKNQLIIELEDRVLIIPYDSVQRIEITPTPDKLPAYAIRGAETM